MLWRDVFQNAFEVLGRIIPSNPKPHPKQFCDEFWGVDFQLSVSGLSNGGADFIDHKFLTWFQIDSSWRGKSDAHCACVGFLF